MLKPSTIVAKGLVANLFKEFLKSHGYKVSKKKHELDSVYALYQFLVDMSDFLIVTAAVGGQCDLPDVGLHEFVVSKRTTHKVRSLYRFRLSPVIDDFFRDHPEYVNKSGSVDMEQLDAKIAEVFAEITNHRNKRHARLVYPTDE